MPAKSQNLRYPQPIRRCKICKKGFDWDRERKNKVNFAGNKLEVEFHSFKVGNDGDIIMADWEIYGHCSYTD